MMNLSNFASLFPFRTLGNQSPINSILEGKDVSLEKLLDEESFSSEFKSQNPKLMQFLKYDKYKTLIEYVTIVGPEEDNKRSCKFKSFQNRYPFIAAEVLTTDNNTLVDYLLPEKDLYIEEEQIEHVEVEEEVEVEQNDIEDEELPALDPVPTIMKPEQSPLIGETNEAENENDNEKEKEVVDMQEQVADKQAADDVVQDKQTDDKETQQKLDDDKQEESNKKQSQTQSVEEEEKEDEEKKPKTRMEKRIVKKQVVTKVKKQVEPLIGDLFSYLDEELNYTLAGYFSRVITSLFNKKSTSLTTYFFSQGRYLKLIKHIASRSIAELVVKLLTLDTSQYITERQEVMSELLSQLSEPWGQDINTPINLSFVLYDVIEKSAAGVKTTQGAKQLLSFIYTPKFCERLLTNTVSDVQEVAIYSAPVLLIALNSIRTLAENKEQCKNLQLVQKYSDLMTTLKYNLAKSSEFSVLFKGFLVKAVERLDSEKSRSTTLGLGRIKLIESLFYMLKFDLFNLKASISQTDFFQKLFGIMKKYQMNNVLHNQVVKVISFVLESDEGESLISNLIEQGKIMEFLHESVLEDQVIQSEIADKKKGSRRKGYIGHIVKMGQMVKPLENNPKYSALFETDQWAAISKLVDKETYQANKNLAGYSSRRGDAASNIMFSKEDILALHHKFLSQPPVTTYPPVDESSKDQIDDAIQLFQENLRKAEASSPVQSETVEEQEQQDKKEQTRLIEEQREKEVEEGREINSLVSYWKDTKKMKYAIHDIMSEIS